MMQSCVTFHRWVFDEGTTEPGKKPEDKKSHVKPQGHVLSKQDLFQQQYGKLAATKKTQDGVEADVDFMKLNKPDDNK